jgi:hypothetical protein
MIARLIGVRLLGAQDVRRDVNLVENAEANFGSRLLRSSCCDDVNSASFGT